jgi:uncharacterized membrane protein
VHFGEAIEVVGKTLDVVGVAVIVIGALVATVLFVGRARQHEASGSYRTYRHSLGRSILLGLEVLVAADIIRTVAVEPDFRSVGVLAIIVLVRTFLSLSLELEINGRWPWQPPLERRAADGSLGGAAQAS